MNIIVRRPLQASLLTRHWQYDKKNQTKRVILNEVKNPTEKIIVILSETKNPTE